MDFSQSVERPPRKTIFWRIEFRDVKFIYPSASNERVILEHLNLFFEQGKKVAPVGESGCSKSTSVYLIERLYETIGTEVLIDGMDIKKYDVKYLRSLISYAQQELVLFNKSIRDNYPSQLGNVDDMI
jgi:ATP-binding cassette subfamily B (MDR/TAP) protein 1